MCKECGKELPGNSKFCAFCGATIGGESELVAEKKPTKGFPQTPAEKSTEEKKPPTWVGCLIIIVVLGIIGGVIGVCTRDTTNTGGPAMTFEVLGCKGETCFVVLLSPSADEVSARDLANRLHQDWHDVFDSGRIHIILLDDRMAAQRWIELWNSSDAEWAKAEAQIYPHWIANYDRNKNSGLNEVLIFSRDANADLVQTIKF